jgi:hypothetical protein
MLGGVGGREFESPAYPIRFFFTMKTPTTKSHENRRLHPTMTVVDAKICRQMEAALRSVMETPIPHGVGCSHDDKTCTCHRSKAFAALDNFKANVIGESSPTGSADGLE